MQTVPFPLKKLNKTEHIFFIFLVTCLQNRPLSQDFSIFFFNCDPFLNLFPSCHPYYTGWLHLMLCPHLGAHGTHNTLNYETKLRVTALFLQATMQLPLVLPPPDVILKSNPKSGPSLRCFTLSLPQGFVFLVCLPGNLSTYPFIWLTPTYNLGCALILHLFESFPVPTPEFGAPSLCSQGTLSLPLLDLNCLFICLLPAHTMWQP